MSMILSPFFMLGSTGIIAGNDGTPVKHGNKLVCSNCTSPEDVNINKAAYNESMLLKVPYADLTGLMPVTPKEASFDDEDGSVDTLIVKAFKPVPPSEAGFNDEDTVTIIDIRRLAPITPSKAGFEDIR
jgi:hypothetical protein